ncbi:8-amino-7-oxononanoate synthase, partial [Candidatus Saganbacteria bacterium]|nr:8-amino-7-oxononanoate synthase [Candidatus Saganbacteria bacterium]
IEKINGNHVTIGEEDYLNFCSNNYLGLAGHPQVIEKAAEALKTFGFGAGASRLICGNTILHEELERKIAQFKNRQAAIVFPTGYMANLGAITSLVDENDTVIIDRLNHASIIDAGRLSKAKLQVYKHCDMQSLKSVLQRSEKFRRRLIVTDSVFSMDGDLAPLPEIVPLAKEFDAMTMIDDAHATGVIGKSGRGSEEHFNIPGKIDIVMGTLSKALGSLGGFVAGDQRLIDYLRNKARSFIYTTALPPAACAAAMSAIEIIEADLGLLHQLKHNISLYHSLVHTPGSLSPIIPIMIGDAKKTMDLSQKLFAKGIFLSGIRPPTVPEGESRLRLTVSAIHSKEEIEFLVSVLRSYC